MVVYFLMFLLGLYNKSNKLRWLLVLFFRSDWLDRPDRPTRLDSPDREDRPDRPDQLNWLDHYFGCRIKKGSARWGTTNYFYFSANPPPPGISSGISRLFKRILPTSIPQNLSPKEPSPQGIRRQDFDSILSVLLSCNILQLLKLIGIIVNKAKYIWIIN